ncbi:MAG TPA: alkylhydroperoxidase [Betaproteobacteria bacterium]|nr:alkylhydroperoxidase [Betaproteobacteria bacterium]
MKLFDHPSRIDRSRYGQIAPAVTAALSALGKAVDDSGLDKPLTELVKLRASQINGCAFCIQYHLNAARKLGGSSAKLDLVAAWRDAGVFSARERTALAWTEALTLMAGNGVSDTAYIELQGQFSESEIAFLTAAVGAINVWNRIAGALHFAPPVVSEPIGSGDES